MRLVLRPDCFFDELGSARVPSGTIDQVKRVEALTTKRGQWLVEYALLVMAVVAAFLIMSNYVRRAFNTKSEFIQKELSGG